MLKVFLLTIILSSSINIFGQKEPEFYSRPDSIETIIKEHIAPPFEIKPNFFIPLNAINSFPLSLRLGLYSNDPVPENNFELNSDLLYPSQLLINEKSKLSFLYNILGAAQIGAVGYLAYKHVKKFGLLK